MFPVSLRPVLRTVAADGGLQSVVILRTVAPDGGLQSVVILRTVAADGGLQSVVMSLTSPPGGGFTVDSSQDVAQSIISSPCLMTALFLFGIL